MGQGEGDHELTWRPGLPVFLSLPVPPPVSGGQDSPMSPHPSPTYERLQHTIAERMSMRPIDQPLMLKELLGHGLARQQPARARQRT